jgi:hypothetical protein
LYGVLIFLVYQTDDQQSNNFVHDA